MIDEKKLIAELKKYIEKYSDLDENVMHNLKWCAMMEALELVEKQEKEGWWNLCSEKLPKCTDGKVSDFVRVRFDNGGNGIGVYRNDEKQWWTRLDEGQVYYTTDNCVVEWAYLPDNYYDGREQ